jgi:flavorubredoxin
VEPKVAVIYDTMWKSTTSLAEAIVEGASQPGVSVLLLHARRVDLTRIATEVLDAAALGIGSATLNRQMLPAMAAVLCYLEGLRPTGKAALAFGSYGWGRGGPEAVHAWLEKMGWEILEPPIRAAYRPTAEVLEQCQAAGRKLAQMAVNKASVKSA